jgi:hypothetical protein
MFSNLTSQVSNLWGKKPEDDGTGVPPEDKVASPVIEETDPNADPAAKVDAR